MRAANRRRTNCHVTGEIDGKLAASLGRHVTWIVCQPATDAGGVVQPERIAIIVHHGFLPNPDCTDLHGL